jgi:protein SCO1
MSALATAHPLGNDGDMRKQISTSRRIAGAGSDSTTCQTSHARRGLRIPAVVLLLSLTSLFGGCQIAGRRYRLRGTVLVKDVAGQKLTVDAEAIPGFIAAMAMPYPVRDPGGLEAAEPGDKIAADVVVMSNRSYWIEHVVITDKSGRGSIPGAAPGNSLQAGDHVPDVPLVDQDGKTLHVSQFKGKAVLITFIYTRCPFPDYCPLMSNEFAMIHDELAKNPEEYGRTHLLSISLDPAYDKPPVLRRYGLGYLKGDAKGFAQWEFVSTTPGDLKKLANAFGLAYSTKDNVISHNLDTILLGPDGAVVKRWPGNEWRTSEVLEAMRQIIGEKE